VLLARSVTPLHTGDRPRSKEVAKKHPLSNEGTCRSSDLATN
jgi:hypothetical protein